MIIRAHLLHSNPQSFLFLRKEGEQNSLTGKEV